MIKCNFIRGTSIESTHNLYGVVVDSNKKILHSFGDCLLTVPARSTLKPFQSAAALKEGSYRNFTEKEVTLTCASHNGQPKHINTAQAMLDKLNFSKEDLECGKHPPHLEKNKKRYNNLHNNCSGKHIGMLAFSKTLKTNNKNYIHQKHPVQKNIKKYLERLLNKKINDFAIDGCSAPTPYLSILDIAHLYAQLCEGKREELKNIYEAISKNPFLLAGDKRFDTTLITALNKKGISKGGAEGLLAIAVKNKKQNIGICIKSMDGSSRARGIVAAKLLQKLKLLTQKETESLSRYLDPPILNLNKIKTGYVQVEF